MVGQLEGLEGERDQLWSRNAQLIFMNQIFDKLPPSVHNVCLLAAGDVESRFQAFSDVESPAALLTGFWTRQLEGEKE